MREKMTVRTVRRVPENGLSFGHYSERSIGSIISHPISVLLFAMSVKYSQKARLVVCVCMIQPHLWDEMLQQETV